MSKIQKSFLLQKNFLIAELSVLLVASLFFGCSYEFAGGGQKTTTPTTPVEKQKKDPLTPEATIQYSTVNEYSLATCKFCHSGTNKPLLSDLQGLKSNIFAVIDVVEHKIAGKEMPPPTQGYNALSACQIDLIKKWAADGFAEKSDASVIEIESCRAGLGVEPEKNILEMPINFQTFSKMILQKKCLSCHNEAGTDEARENPLYPYTALASRPGLLGKSREKSKFIRILTNPGEGRMPPLDSDIKPLTEDELEFVKRLIDAGYPEN